MVGEKVGGDASGGAFPLHLHAFAIFGHRGFAVADQRRHGIGRGDGGVIEVEEGIDPRGLIALVFGRIAGPVSFANDITVGFKGAAFFVQPSQESQIRSPITGEIGGDGIEAEAIDIVIDEPELEDGTEFFG